MPRFAPVVLIAISLIAIGLSLGCGSSPIPCDAPASSASSSTCTCTGACPAQQYGYVYAAGANAQVAGFPIDLTTGGLETPVTASGPIASPGMAALDNVSLYASNPQSGNGGAIDAWTIGYSTGMLTAVSGSPFSLGATSVPTGIVAASNLGSPGPFLYVADSGAIDALEASLSTGVLTLVPGSPFSSGTNQYLATDYLNHFLFAADEDPPGGVLAFTINASSGALTPVPGSPFPISNSAVQVGHIAVDPTGSFVYVAIPSTNQVAAFSITPSSGVLTPISGSPFAAGNGASAVITINNQPANNLLYVSNTTAGTISGYTINSTGALNPLAGSPFSISAELIAADGAGHLYVSAASGITVFSINAASGSLTPIGSPATFAGATTLAVVAP